MELQAKKAERYRALKSQLREKDLLSAALQQRALNEAIVAYESQLTDAENRFIEHVTALRSKETESETGAAFADGGRARNRRSTGDRLPTQGSDPNRGAKD
jgi:chromosome segregation ATPase